MAVQPGTGRGFGMFHRARDPLHGETIESVHVDALPVRYDHTAFLKWFDATWPVEPAAGLSYRQRIMEGPRYEPEQALRALVRQTAEVRTAVPL
jgi:hypothetical protein